jgi:hypothetical protein
MTLSPDQLAVLFRHLFNTSTEELESADLTLELDLPGSPLGAVVIETEAARREQGERWSSILNTNNGVQIG